jgi:3-oxoacyl-[acyl-carrier-protein] synthase II
MSEGSPRPTAPDASPEGRRAPARHAVAIAARAISPLGDGDEAVRAAELDEPARVVVRDDETLTQAGLARPLAARAPRVPEDTGDRATDLLLHVLAPLVAELDARRPGWRGERVGVYVGTSSGGMLVAERFFRARDDGFSSLDEAAARALARGATYFAPLDHALGAVSLEPARRAHVLAACAASTIALGLASRALEQGDVDVAIAGGYDGVSVFVAAGFEALRATTASRCRPFRVGRDGMSLGEGAALVALVRACDAQGAAPLFHLAGFGASNDAVHITAPDRTGAGLARAARAALDDAGATTAALPLVSAHATATPFNDAMEAKAIEALYEGHEAPWLHPMKAQVGHTLGAAGVLETLAAVDSARRGLIPAAAGDGELDPDAPARLAERSIPRSYDAFLKLSAAFGGTNASLVVSREAPLARAPRGARRVALIDGAHVTEPDLDLVSRVSGVARDRLGRLDAIGRLALTAATRLAEQVGAERLRGAGVIVGHALATLDTNDAYDARRRAKGARFVEPRAFPATSPNLVAGELAIAFGCTGPGFATGAGLSGGLEALELGCLLLRAGDAERLLVVAVDDAGPAALDWLARTGTARPFARGAVALLLEASAPSAASERDEPGFAPPTVDHARGPIGHLALVPLVPPSRRA